jgi:hypothetical protein
MTSEVSSTKNVWTLHNGTTARSQLLGIRCGEVDVESTTWA